MQDITEQAIESIMRVAPVWAASLAGRTRVFTDESIPTACVSGGNGRFKILVNPKIANSRDMTFILMHEISHIFRRDLISMQTYPSMAQEINIASDCIINDSLVAMGVPAPSMAKDICWGKDIYGKNCTNRSINELLKVKLKDKDKQKAAQKATAPGNVNEQGQEIEEEEGGGGVGADEKFCEKIGLGKDPVIHDELKPMAQSVAAFARRNFFAQGFKSKNIGTRMDWRKNRPAFSHRTDIRIPATRIGEYGNEHRGPLVNLVLDTSGSMEASWVATAAAIAKEISEAGLDYDLWLTPMRRKATNPQAVLHALMNHQSPGQYLASSSHENAYHWRGGGAIDKVSGLTPTRNQHEPKFDSSLGADELFALGLFETEDPVTWVYVGDYRSRMGLQMHGDPNFLHVVMTTKSMPRDTKACVEIMRENSLPHWIYGMDKK